jgi:hypothetical protein
LSSSVPSPHASDAATRLPSRAVAGTVTVTGAPTAAAQLGGWKL